MGISDRFKEERTRLGLSQTALAEKIGATKRSVINWEGGAASPSTDAVAEFAKVGADVLYILTGVRSGATVVLRAEQPPAGYTVEAIDMKEKKMLEIFRMLPDDLKDSTQALMSAATESGSKIKKKKAA